MIRKREEISEVEQLRQGERQPTSGNPVIHNRRTVRLEELEPWFSVPAAPLSAGLAREEGFITDWADS